VAALLPAAFLGALVFDLTHSVVVAGVAAVALQVAVAGILLGMLGRRFAGYEPGQDAA